MFTPLIPRNTTIPTKKSEVFSTATDGQSQVEVHVMQGERPMAAHNKTLGRFVLDGIPPAPRGMPQIEVSFDIDANGIVNVTAKDKATGREQKVEIKASSGLDDSEIERMVQEAEQHAKEDEARRENIETKNKLDQLVYQVEKAMNDAKDKLPVEHGQEIAQAIEEAKAALAKEDDPEGWKAAEEKLMAASSKMAEHLYQDNGAAPGAEGAPANGAAPGASKPTDDDSVIDADYQEVN